MRTWFYILMLSQVPFLLGARTPDQELEVCRGTCETSYSACQAELPGDESKARKVEEAVCEMEIKACYADCDEARSFSGMIRKHLVE